MQSIWTLNTALPAREPLKTDICADVCIIGGGMAGMLTAYYLQQKGLNAVIIEADRAGRGQTGHTTAKITSQHNLIYADLIDKIGRDAAKQYADANEHAIIKYRSLVQDLSIDCQFETRPAYLYSLTNTAPLEREALAAQELGLSAKFCTETDLPFQVKGALRFDGQAQFHPLEFLNAISSKLEIYEQTMVQKIEDNLVITSGGSVKAKSIVMATHYPFINAPGYYFMRMHQERSYVLALKNTQPLTGLYLGIDPDSYSFRSSGEYLLLGGGSHRTGENSAGGQYERLSVAAEQYFPGCAIAAKWSAQDCMTLDGIPYIGNFSESTPNLYVATGFNKWGMTSSMVAAELLTDLICGIPNDSADLFSPQRFHFSASAKNMMEDGLQAVKGLTRGIFHVPAEDIDALPRGHGGIIECNGEKVGVYKDQEGKSFIVSARCPHLGCQLEWNPDEKSWDCPCHGSRFDYMGNLLDNPAMEPLSHSQ